MYRLRFNIILLVFWVAAIVGAAVWTNFPRYWDMVYAVILTATFIVTIGRISLHRLVLPLIFISYSLVLVTAQAIPFIPDIPLAPVTVVVKLLIVTLTIVLAQRLVYELVDFEDSVTGLSLDLAGLSPRIFNYEMDEVYREVRRARRYDQNLTLAVVRPDYSNADVDVTRISAELLDRLRNRYLQVKLMERWSIDLNDSDIVVREGSEFILAFPNTSAEKVQSMLKDYETHTAEWGLPLAYGIASMPDEAVTYAKLIDQARESLDNNEPQPPSGGVSDELQPALVP